MIRIFFVLALFTSSCMTTSPQHEDQNQQPNTTPKESELLVFIQRQTDEKEILSNGDLVTLSQIPPRPERGTVQEAALTVGAIKKVLHPTNTAQQPIRETETRPAIPSRNAVTVAKSKVVTPPTQLSLEQSANSFGVDVLAAIQTNMLLKNARIYQLTLKSLEYGKNSDDFNRRLREGLAKELTAWKDVAVSSSNHPLETPIKIDEPKPADIHNPEVAAVRINDLPTGDEQTLLKDAQSLADAGQYETAITKVQTIPDSSKNYLYAQDRVKFFSNRAVQDLRKKAAQEFQSAMPVNDPNAKKSYLLRAQANLKEALEKYPKADNLKTVEDNLAVVNKEIERLQ